MKSATRNVRIVIDTNVLVSAIVFGGKPRKVLDLLADGSAVAVVAAELITEGKRVIATKFPDFLSDLAKVEKLLEANANWILLGGISLRVCRDPEDDKFLETAVIGRATYIVSGDNDLLELGVYQNIRILPPAEFLAALRQA